MHIINMVNIKFKGYTNKIIQKFENVFCEYYEHIKQTYMKVCISHEPKVYFWQLTSIIQVRILKEQSSMLTM